MSEDERVPIIILRDRGMRSHLSAELTRNGENDVRIFGMLSGTGISLDPDSLERLKSLLLEMNATNVFFEDIGKNALTGILKKLGYRVSSKPIFRRRDLIQWSLWNEPPPSSDFSCFGIASDTAVTTNQSMRRLMLSDRRGFLGEIAFTDYGSFARCRANQFGLEGFGRLYSDVDPSQMLSVLCRELKRERKRYLILGHEFAQYSGEIHPFPLWHMVLSHPVSYDHNCRIAGEEDIPRLAQLVAEYENNSCLSALNGVKKRFSNPSFQYMLSAGDEGFALIKFSEGAEGMLHDLYITPEHQGKGIGDELTKASINNLSISCLRIHLNTIYMRAKRLYEKYGFDTQYEDLCVALAQKMMIRT